MRIDTTGDNKLSAGIDYSVHRSDDIRKILPIMEMVEPSMRISATYESTAVTMCPFLIKVFIGPML